MTYPWRIQITRHHPGHWGARITGPGRTLLHRVSRDSQPAALAAALMVAQEMAETWEAEQQEREKNNG